MSDYLQLARLATRPATHPTTGHPAAGTTAARTSVGAAIAGPSEMLALAHAAVKPIAVVSGTAVTRISTGLTSSNRLGEIESLTSAMEAARTQAVARLLAAAGEYGAGGVVGVTPRVRWHGHRRRHTLELTLIGTAVSAASTAKDNDAPIFAATLDGVAVARLMWSGWWPVGLAVGTSVFGFPRRSWSSWARLNWHGGEAAHPTSALYAAREAALRRLQDDARSFNADGVVDIDVRHDQHVWGHRAMELSAIGTAVARVSDAEIDQPPALALSVADTARRRRADLR